MAGFLTLVGFLILPIESLFVFGTNAENLKEIIKTLKEEKQDKSLEVPDNYRKYWFDNFKEFAVKLQKKVLL